MTSTEFSVHMKPITQGSVTAFPIKRKNGSVGAVITHNHSNELYSLRSAIEDEYRKADAHAEMLRRRKAGGTMAEDGYVTMTMLFTFVRPKSVKAKKRPDMTVKPDLDKLCRTVLDALTGVAYKDDSQVIGIIANKRYGEVEMLHVKVVSG